MTERADVLLKRIQTANGGSIEDARQLALPVSAALPTIAARNPSRSPNPSFPDLGLRQARSTGPRSSSTVGPCPHAAFATALLIMGATPNTPVLWLGVALLGVGMGTGLYSTAFATLVERRGAEARRGITAVSLIGALGGGLGWPVSRAVTATAGWRTACAVWAAAHLVICLPLTLKVPPQREPRASMETSRGRLRWDRRMIQIAGVFAGAWMVSTAMGAHLPGVLGALGISASGAAWAAGLMAASAISATLIDLLALHKSQPLATLRLACLLHPLGAAVALIGGVKSAPLPAIGQGAGNGLLSVASGVLPLRAFGPDRYAVRQTMLLTPARYLQAAAPAAYAIALDASVTIALVLSGSVCLLMFGLSFGLHKGDQEPTSELR